MLYIRSVCYISENSNEDNQRGKKPCSRHRTPLAATYDTPAPYSQNVCIHGYAYNIKPEVATLTNRHSAPTRRLNIMTCDAATSYVCFQCKQKSVCESCCPFRNGIINTNCKASVQRDNINNVTANEARKQNTSEDDLIKDILGVPVPGKDDKSKLSGLPSLTLLAPYDSSPKSQENQQEHHRTYTSSFVNINKPTQPLIASRDGSTSNNEAVGLGTGKKFPKPCPCTSGCLVIPGPKCVNDMNTNTRRTTESSRSRRPKRTGSHRDQDDGDGNVGSSNKRKHKFPALKQADLDELGAKLMTLESLASDIERGSSKECRTGRHKISTSYQGLKVGATAAAMAATMKTAGVPGEWPLVGVYSIETYDFEWEKLNPSKKPSSSVTFGDIFGDGLTKETFLYGCYSTKSLTDYFKTCPYGCTQPKVKEGRDPNADWDESIDGPKYCDFGCPRAEEYWIPPRCIRCAQEMFEEQQAKLLAEKDKRAAEKAAQREKEKRAAAEAERKARAAEIEAEKQAAAAKLEKKLGPMKAANEKKAAEAQKKADKEKAGKEKKEAAEKAAQQKRAAAEKAAEEKQQSKEREKLEKKMAAEKAAKEKKAAAEERKKMETKLAAEKKVEKEKAAREKKAAAEKAAAEKKERQEKEAAEKKIFDDNIAAKKAAAEEVKAAAAARAAAAAAERYAADKKEEEEFKALKALAKKCCICKDTEGKNSEGKEAEGQDSEDIGDTNNQSTPPCKCKYDPPSEQQFNQGDDNKQGPGEPSRSTGRTGSNVRRSLATDENGEQPVYVIRKWAEELESVAFEKNQKKPCVPKNCQCDVPFCSGHYKSEFTISLDRPAPPCGNPEDGGVKQLSCTEECKFQGVCKKFHATMASDMARIRSGFTVNVKQRACETCDTIKVCKEDLCGKGKEKQHVCECPGGISGFRLAQPCQSRPCPRRNSFKKD